MVYITHTFKSVNSFETAKSVSLSIVSTHLPELFDLGSLHPNDRASQALVDQQTQLTVKIHAIVLLVLRETIIP